MSSFWTSFCDTNDNVCLEKIKENQNFKSPYIDTSKHSVSNALSHNPCLLFIFFKLYLLSESCAIMQHMKLERKLD